MLPPTSRQTGASPQSRLFCSACAQCLSSSLQRTLVLGRFVGWSVVHPMWLKRNGWSARSRAYTTTGWCMCVYV
jgi:hypothetical protein